MWPKHNTFIKQTTYDFDTDKKVLNELSRIHLQLENITMKDLHEPSWLEIAAKKGSIIIIAVNCLIHC